MLAQVTLPPGERTDPVFESLWRLSDPVTFVDNPVGRVLFDVSGPSYLGYMERAARVPAARERLSAALAALPVRAAGAPTAAQGDHQASRSIVHGFHTLCGALPEAEAAVADLIACLRRWLHGAWTVEATPEDEAGASDESHEAV